MLHVGYHTEIICSPEARQATGGGPGGMVGHVRQTVSDPEEGGPGPVHRQETGQGPDAQLLHVRHTQHTQHTQLHILHIR